jgi:hypothetical protein
VRLHILLCFLYSDTIIVIVQSVYACKTPGTYHRSLILIFIFGGEIFAPVQTGPGANPASYTMDTGFFPGVDRPGSGVNHPHPSSAEVKYRVELYLYSPSEPSWPVLE